jgi:succinate dehydrogenase / fumarate reductase membrane anchor subunit
MKETAYWTWFIIAAIVILFLGGLHIVIMHLSALGFYNPGGGAATNWENVAFRSQHQFIAFTYIILLGAALYHGLYGLRTIIFELGPRKSFQECFTVFLWIIGLILFGVGAYSDLAAKSLGKAL